MKSRFANYMAIVIVFTALGLAFELDMKYKLAALGRREH